jgi:hypothetical protein
MKIKNIYVTYLVSLSFLLGSCQTESKSYKITLFTNGPISNFDSETETGLNKLKEVIPYFSIDSKQYLCSSAEFVRLDLNNNAEKLVVLHSMPNKIKIAMGVELSSEDLLNDYNDSSNIQYPKSLEIPTEGKFPKEFPNDCIICNNLDSLKIIIRNILDTSRISPHIKIGITIANQVNEIQPNNIISNKEKSKDETFPRSQKQIISNQKDTDEDGIINNLDKCPYDFGLDETGCPINFPKSSLGINKSDDGTHLTWNSPISKKENKTIQYILEFYNLDNNELIAREILVNNYKYEIASLKSKTSNGERPKNGVDVKITATCNGFISVQNKRHISLTNSFKIFNCL